MTALYRPEDEPEELCSRCGHRERAHVPAPIGTCTVSEVTEGSWTGCTCKGYLAYSPEPVEDPRGYLPENLLKPWEDPCHAILWLEGTKDKLMRAQNVIRTKLVCRFATGHEDPFHEHYDGTRWMIQTEDR